MSVKSNIRSEPQACPWVMSIKPYKGGESALPGAEAVVKLSSNENPMGPSPRAIEAYRRCADALSIYPDGAAASLRGAIASVYDIDPDRIVCGAGSDELIANLCYAYCEPGDEVIHTEHGFSMYRISALAAGAKPVSAPEVDLTTSPDAILAAITPRTKLIFIANPNNPTGTYIPASELLRLIDQTPSNVIVVIDGAYAEYMRMDDYDPGFRVVESRSNVVVTRTFSKIYGLAALRLGWAYCPEGVADALNRVRGPFNISKPALAAGVAAVRDGDYTELCAIQNEVWRDWLVKQMRIAGIEVRESWANFVLPKFRKSGPVSASAADAFLRSRGVIVRRMESYGLPEYLRISVGGADDTVLVANALNDFMEGAAV